MTIYADKAIKNGETCSGVVVPSAAVWMQDLPEISAQKRHVVRTIDCSKAARFQKPRSLKNEHAAVHFSQIGVQRISKHLPTAIPTDNPQTSSIKEILKQWAGGGIFGLVIFAGILLSQPQEEVPTPTTYEANIVGVSLGR